MHNRIYLSTARSVSLMKPKRRAAWRALSLAVAGLSVASCRSAKTIQGRVIDFESREPIAGVAIFANQSGWGIESGRVVWDKEYRYRAESGPSGEFVLQYRVGSDARLRVDLDGYNRFLGFAGPGKAVEVRLKRLPPPHPRLPSGEMRLGTRTDGTLYGWSFASAAIASSCAKADVLPEQVDADTRGPILINACGRGGLLFVPAESLGVEGEFLVYGDTAPEEGYTKQLLLDFSGRGGLVFVRTRDGLHYAKFQFTPRAFGGIADRDVKRDAAFIYVFDPSGARYLPFEIPSSLP